MKFSEWLLAEMEKREWSNSDLARKAGLSRQAIGYYLEGRKPNNDALVKIARALGVTNEAIMRQVSILPPKSKRDELIEEAEHLFSQLESEDSKQIAINFLRMLQGNKKKPSRTGSRAAESGSK